MFAAPLLALSLALAPPLAQVDGDFDNGFDNDFGEPNAVQVDGDAGALGLLGGGLCGLVVLALAAASVIAFIWALVDIIKREDLDGTMKLIWILVVLFTGVLGAIVYYFVGRSPGGSGGAGAVKRDDTL
ncbi:PLD nuclease N-terminal domain-containing protein [Alienimonas sp. DA493]|uniref:PLD nuclease N-terminal domain-containing protein n=1 Tax=Alienimonas sp. DA493 TaxID=3373605 RepID=UPI0037544FB1